MKILTIILLVFISIKTSYAQKSSDPTLSETLNWIRSKCLSYPAEMTYSSSYGDITVGLPTDVVVNESECSITFVYANSRVSTYRYTIYFSALNGNTITWFQDYGNLYINVSAKSGGTASFGRYPPGGDYVDKSGSPRRYPTLQIPFNKSTFQGEDNLQERMTKAIKRAIVLCGGEFTEEKF